MPKVEFTVHIEAKDEAEAKELMQELGDWQSKMSSDLHGEIDEAKVEHRGGAEDTLWNFAKPVDKAPEGVEVVKLPEGWRGALPKTPHSDPRRPRSRSGLRPRCHPGMGAMARRVRLLADRVGFPGARSEDPRDAGVHGSFERPR